MAQEIVWELIPLTQKVVRWLCLGTRIWGYRRWPRNCRRACESQSLRLARASIFVIWTKLRKTIQSSSYQRCFVVNAQSFQQDTKWTISSSAKDSNPWMPLREHWWTKLSNLAVNASIYLYHRLAELLYNIRFPWSQLRTRMNSLSPAEQSKYHWRERW